MKFIVRSGREEPSTTTPYPHVALRSDNWDDYGYKTTFNIILHLSQKEFCDLGRIKIIQSGMTGGYTRMPKKPFTELTTDYASLGSDLNRTPYF
jgi:hypothetical protein